MRVRTPDVGGGFGAKIGTYPEEIVLGALSKALGRPVRWTETRSESMVGLGHGRAQVQNVTIGGSRDGKVTHYRLQVLQDSGAFADMGTILAPFMTRRCRRASTRSPTSVPHDVGGHEHDTDRRVPGRRAPRGHGGHRTGDGHVRRRDRHRPGRGAAGQPDRPVHRAAHHGHRPDYDVGDYVGSLDRVLEAAGYDQLRAEQQARRDSGDTVQLGIGVSIYVEITGGVATARTPRSRSTTTARPPSTRVRRRTARATTPRGR